MASLPLTARQERAWRFIGGCQRSPTYDEIRVALGLKSKGNVSQVVLELEERGYIERLPNRRRSLVALERPRVIRQELEVYSDAELIAELERRTQAALNRVKTPVPSPWNGPRRVQTDQDRLRDAKEGSAHLREAILLVFG